MAGRITTLKSTPGTKGFSLDVDATLSRVGGSVQSGCQSPDSGRSRGRGGPGGLFASPSPLGNDEHKVN